MKSQQEQGELPSLSLSPPCGTTRRTQREKAALPAVLVVVPRLGAT